MADHPAKEHYELAAKQHRAAAEAHDNGEHDKAAHHAHLAYGHLAHATHHTEEAAKKHTTHTSAPKV